MTKNNINPKSHKINILKQNITTKVAKESQNTSELAITLAGLANKFTI